MAIVACDVCDQTPAGRLYGLYMTVVRDGKRYSRRLKLCENDVDSLCQVYGRNWSDGFILNRFTAVTTCTSCGKERGPSGSFHPMYVTAYSAKGTRYDYYATYCDEDSQTLIDTFSLEVRNRE